jgi:hypothetical protein
MIVNIVDDEVRKEVRRVMHEELKRCVRSDIDKYLPKLVVDRIKSHYERVVNDRISKTLADHMEIEVTIFLQKELNKHETFIRERFDAAIEKVLSQINFENYFRKILGANIDAIVDARIKEQLKKSFHVEIKENT